VTNRKVDHYGDRISRLIIPSVIWNRIVLNLGGVKTKFGDFHFFQARMTEWATAQGRGRNNKRRNNKSESQAKAADIKGYTKADPAHAEDELTIHDLPPEVHAHLFGFFNARDLLWPVPVVGHPALLISSPLPLIF